MQIIHKSMPSQSCNKTIDICFYVPNEYTRIFILLHGHGGSIREVERLFPLAEYAKKYRFLIAVPELGNGFYLDRIGVDGEADFYVSKFLCEELPKVVKRDYHLHDDVDIILGGYSMGGFGTLLHGLNNRGAFQALISVSGAFIANEIAFGSDFVVGAEFHREELFDTFMIKEGELPIDVLLDDVHRNPEAIIEQLDTEKREELPTIILTCATRDIWCSTTQRVKKALLEKEIPFYYLEIENGEHDFKEFDQGFRFAFDKITVW